MVLIVYVCLQQSRRCELGCHSKVTNPNDDIVQFSKHNLSSYFYLGCIFCLTHTKTRRRTIISSHLVIYNLSLNVKFHLIVNKCSRDCWCLCSSSKATFFMLWPLKLVQSLADNIHIKSNKQVSHCLMPYFISV